MIYPEKSKIFQGLFSKYILVTLKKHFQRIYITGEENLKPDNPVIFYMNHTCWWDPLIVFYLSVMRWKYDGYAVMDLLQLTKYRFFRKFGVFSIDRQNGREALKSIEFAAKLLDRKERCLWIFPQGEMHPSNYRPIKFYSGISRIISKSKPVDAVPITFHYEFIQEQRPEIFISIGKPETFADELMPPAKMTLFLEQKLVNNLELERERISKKDFTHYKEIISGKRSISALFFSADRERKKK